MMVRVEKPSLPCLEQVMDRPERFPRTMLDICQQDDIDILVGVVTNHCAHASIVALFLREHDFTSTINSELYPISVHLLPVILHMVEHLGSEEGCRRLGREQGACFHLPEKPVQIAGGSVCTAIGRSDGWKSIDIFLPGHNSPMLITEWIAPLGDILIYVVHAEEIRVEHSSGCENMPAYIVPIGQTACLFDEQAQQHIAAITVATSLARLEIGGLVRKLREKVSGLGDRIVGSSLPNIRVILPALFFSIIRDT